jgi:hypothetical protein
MALLIQLQLNVFALIGHAQDIAQPNQVYANFALVGFEVLEGIIADLERYHGYVRRVYCLQLQALFGYRELNLIHQR